MTEVRFDWLIQSIYWW